MAREIRADYGQGLLFPPRVEDWISADHPVRVVREFVRTVDLAALGFEMEPALEGRPRYAPDLLLCVVLYGWMTRIRTSRTLEKACRESLPFIWLTGNNPPDHNTIARFFKRYRKELRGVFKETVRVADSMGLVAMVTNALDGTKILAASSSEKAIHKKVLDRRLVRLNEASEKTLKAIEQQMEKEGELADDRLVRELTDQQKLREELVSKLEQLKKEGRSSLHLKEPDAQMMKCRREGTQLAYNAQAVVDAKVNVVVAEEVVTAQNDLEQLVPMLQKVEETVGRRATETVADAGYHTGDALSSAESHKFSVIVNEPGRPERAVDGVDLRASNFRFDRERDSCVCPIGKELSFERTKPNKQHVEVRVYRCGHHRECALASVCSKDRRGRSIEISPHYEAVAKQRAKRKLPEKRELLRRRGSWIERLNAYIKSVTGFRRFTLRGQAGAAVQWSLCCAAHNLWIIARKMAPSGAPG